MKALYISHRAYWYYLSTLEKKYDGLEIDYIEYTISDTTTTTELKNFNDYDYIIYFSTNYVEDNIRRLLTSLATKTSSKKDKRVTVGYSYILPENKRINQDIFCEVELISVKNNLKTNRIIKEDPVKPKFNPLDLTKMVINEHNELENQKVKKR